MPGEIDELFYINAVKWIQAHPEDKSISKDIKRDFLRFNELPLKNKIELLTALHTALKTTGLPEEIKQSLPYLTFDLDALPDDLLLKMGSHLKDQSDLCSLVSISKRMYNLFQPKRLLDKFLQCVAYGQQDEAERLFTNVYQGNAEKIQRALLYQQTFTDYSGRTFNCSAYEYAYWAKDTHMCRMLERYMDDTTKAAMAARIDKMECINAATGQPVGLKYQQNGIPYCSAHFNFTPLIQALQFYVDNYGAWYAANNWSAMEAAWMNVGLAQRDVPAHVAQEYCRLDRAFYPCPSFNEPALPRTLNFYIWTTSRVESWFPLTSANSGIGFDFALIRAAAARGMQTGGVIWRLLAT